MMTGRKLFDPLVAFAIAGKHSVVGRTVDLAVVERSA